jgi:hypothetical protein
MIALAEILTLTLILTGTATMVNDEWTPVVLENRIRMGHIVTSTSYVGYVALEEAAWIGSAVAIRCTKGHLWGPLLVIDCGEKRHGDYYDQINFAVDIFGRKQWRDCVNVGRSARVGIYEIRDPSRRPQSEAH